MATELKLEWVEEPVPGGWTQWAAETPIGRLVVEEWVRGPGQMPVRPEKKEQARGPVCWTICRVPGPRQGGPSLQFEQREEAMVYAETLLGTRLRLAVSMLGPVC